MEQIPRPNTQVIDHSHPYSIQSHNNDLNNRNIAPHNHYYYDQNHSTRRLASYSNAVPGPASSYSAQQFAPTFDNAPNTLATISQQQIHRNQYNDTFPPDSYMISQANPFHGNMPATSPQMGSTIQYSNAVPPSPDMALRQLGAIHRDVPGSMVNPPQPISSNHHCNAIPPNQNIIQRQPSNLYHDIPGGKAAPPPQVGTSNQQGNPLPANPSMAQQQPGNFYHSVPGEMATPAQGRISNQYSNAAPMNPNMIGQSAAHYHDVSGIVNTPIGSTVHNSPIELTNNSTSNAYPGHFTMTNNNIQIHQEVNTRPENRALDGNSMLEQQKKAAFAERPGQALRASPGQPLESPATTQVQDSTAANSRKHQRSPDDGLEQPEVYVAHLGGSEARQKRKRKDDAVESAQKINPPTQTPATHQTEPSPGYNHCGFQGTPPQYYAPVASAQATGDYLPHTATQGTEYWQTYSSTQGTLEKTQHSGDPQLYMKTQGTANYQTQALTQSTCTITQPTGSHQPYQTTQAIAVLHMRLHAGDSQIHSMNQNAGNLQPHTTTQGPANVQTTQTTGASQTLSTTNNAGVSQPHATAQGTAVSQSTQTTGAPQTSSATNSAGVFQAVSQLPATTQSTSVSQRTQTTGDTPTRPSTVMSRGLLPNETTQALVAFMATPHTDNLDMRQRRKHEPIWDPMEKRFFNYPRDLTMKEFNDLLEDGSMEPSDDSKPSPSTRKATDTPPSVFSTTKKAVDPPSGDDLDDSIEKKDGREETDL